MSGAAVARMVDVCPCGIAFTVSRSNHTYCSDKCRLRFYMREYRRKRGSNLRIRSKCAVCGKPMVVTMKTLGKVYCSPAHRQKAHRDRAAALRHA